MPISRIIRSTGLWWTLISLRSISRALNVLGHVAADAAAVPVVLGRHRPGQRPDVVRQRRPDQDHVEMARVIGEVDALARVRLAVDPADAGPAEEAGHRS